MQAWVITGAAAVAILLGLGAFFRWFSVRRLRYCGELRPLLERLVDQLEIIGSDYDDFDPDAYRQIHRDFEHLQRRIPYSVFGGLGAQVSSLRWALPVGPLSERRRRDAFGAGRAIERAEALLEMVVRRERRRF